jgi:HSP20 family protein
MDKKDVKVDGPEWHARHPGRAENRKKRRKGRESTRGTRIRSFFRTFELPDGIDDQKLKAEFKEGIRLVHLPKTEKAQSKTIEVKVE